MKTLKLIKKLFLLLALIVAGVQSAKADWEPDWEYCVYQGESTRDDVVYYVYKVRQLKYLASIKQINATGDVVIPSNFHAPGVGNATVYSVGWWLDQQQTEAVTCNANLTSLTFEGWPQIHGNFTLSNLTGSLNLNGSYYTTSEYTIVCNDATVSIPKATSFSFWRAKIDGTINAPSITALDCNESSFVSGTINADNATRAKIAGNISGTINIPKATDVQMYWQSVVSGTINAGALKTVSVGTTCTFTGTINAPEATTVDVGYTSSFTGTINAPKATVVALMSGLYSKNKVYGIISSNALTSISMGNVDFGSSGKLDCPNLTDIHIPNNNEVPNFDGIYTSHFTAPWKSITVHVYDMSAKQLAAMKNSATWGGFKEIVNHVSNLNYTLVTDGNATVSLYKLVDTDDYSTATHTSQIAQIISGSKSGTLNAGGDYAVEIKDVDFTSRKVTLKVNGSPVNLQSDVVQGVPVKYYNLKAVRSAPRIEVVVSDKTCNVVFTQEYLYTTPAQYSYQPPIEHYATVTYRKKLDGKTVIGNITSGSSTFTCSQGSELTISAPYGDYEPYDLSLNGTIRGMNYAQGQAKKGFTLPTSEEEDDITFTVDLKWRKVPKPTVIETPDGETVELDDHHQPKITIMRSGEGNILLKGLCNLYDEQQSIDAYEREFGYEAQNGWVVNAVANCIDAVTTVTVPDVDYLGRGGNFDMIDWGFEVNITPVPGQTVKSLMMGWIVTDDDNRQYIEWESFSTTGAYLNDNDGDGTYTFGFAGDEMNWWIGDYILNIVMGPEESFIETGATLNFVRRGGRTEVLFEKEDPAGTLYDQKIEEGSRSFYLDFFTQAEQEESGMDCVQSLQFNPVEDEIIHVLCDATDISDKITYRDDGSAYLNLERKNHTYSIYIEDAPDANPTWTVMQSEGMMGTQVVVTRNGEDEETILANAINTMEINDEGVEKVTLKVPVGNAVPVTKYQIRLESIASGTGTQIVSYLVLKCNMSRLRANALVESLPGLIPKQYDSEADAQLIVDDLTKKGAVAVIVPVTVGTQAIANNTPIRVARNGEEVTFQMDFSDPLYAVYEVPANTLTNATWEVSYDTNHRQTILRTGGTGAVEIGYKYIADDAITLSADRGLTTIDLPSFNSQHSNFVEFAIEAVEGEEVTVYRNGSDVTAVFGEPQLLEGKNWYYFSSYSYDTQSELGFQLREPATWEIKIEESHKMLNAYANNNVNVSIAKVVDGEEPSFVARDNSMHQWVNKGETYIIKFTPKNGEELIRFDIGWNSIDIQQESRLVKNDDGSYSFTLTYDDISTTQGHFDIFAVFESGQAGTSYDLNHDGQVNITDVIILVNRILGND